MLLFPLFSEAISGTFVHENQESLVLNYLPVVLTLPACIVIIVCIVIFLRWVSFVFQTIASQLNSGNKDIDCFYYVYLVQTFRQCVLLRYNYLTQYNATNTDYQSNRSIR